MLGGFGARSHRAQSYFASAGAFVRAFLREDPRRKKCRRREPTPQKYLILFCAGLVSIGVFRMWIPFQVGAASNLPEGQVGGSSGATAFTSGATAFTSGATAFTADLSTADLPAGRQPSREVPGVLCPRHPSWEGGELSASLLDSITNVIEEVGGIQDAAMAQLGELLLSAAGSCQLKSGEATMDAAGSSSPRAAGGGWRLHFLQNLRVLDERRCTSEAVLIALIQGATCFGDDSALDASSEHPHQDRRALEWGHGSWPEGLRECDESGGGDKISWEVAGTHGRRGCVHGRGLYVCHNTSAVDTARGGSKCLLASGAEARVCGQTGGEVRLCGGVLVPGLVLGVSAARVAAVGIDERGRAMAGLADSVEAWRVREEEKVKRAYLSLLRRDADDGGKRAYLAELLAGRVTEEGMRHDLAGSVEGRAATAREQHAIANLSPVLRVVRALSAECASPPRPTVLEEAGDRSLWCESAPLPGMPKRSFDHFMSMYMGAVGMENAEQVSRETWDAAANALRRVSLLYQESLGRFPGASDLGLQVPGLLAGATDAGTLRASLLASTERKGLEAAAAPPGMGWGFITGRTRSPSEAFIEKHCLAETGCPAAEVAALIQAGGAKGEVQRIWNEHGVALLHGFPESRRTREGAARLPVAIYVCNRPHYLREVLGALRRAAGVEDVLLIVSLDADSQEMLDAVRSVDFCAVRVLFHPQPVVAIGAVGGRGSDGVLVVKQHWLFLVRQVFDGIREMRGYKGDVLLLEEDHVPSPDILVTLRGLLAIKNRGEGACAGDAGCWGAYMKFGCQGEGKETDIYKACRVKWFVNTGVAFNRSVFEAIEASDFESFRDGWDWSMYHLIQTRQLLPCQQGDGQIDGQTSSACTPHMLAPAVARISNIGEDGVTVHRDDRSTLGQLRYPRVRDDILDQGFDASQVVVAPYFQHKGPLDQPLWAGFEDRAVTLSARR